MDERLKLEVYMWFAREEGYGKVVEAGGNRKQWSEAKGQRQKQIRRKDKKNVWTVDMDRSKSGRESENMKHVNLERCCVIMGEYRLEWEVATCWSHGGG